MTRDLWVLHRRPVIAVGVAVVVAASVAVVLAGSRPRHSRTARPAPAVQAQPGADVTPGADSARYRPALIAPADTPAQRQVDSQLAAEESPGAIAAAQAITPPPPGVSAALPPVPASARADAYDYAAAFTAELLDVDFALQPRDALLAWVQSEEAANTLPGVPAALSGKALFASLAYPDIPGGSPSPLPSAPAWASAAAAGVSQTVSGIGVETSPDWTSLVAQGWQPADQLMTVQVVTGTVTTRRPGRPAGSRPFSLTLTVGSAAHHPGYGAVAVSDWQEG